MAASAVIGALRINLGLNSASFRSGLAESEQKVGRFGDRAKATFLAVAAAATALYAGLSMVVKGSIDAADEMSKTAQKAGLTIESMSRLAYAGRYADVSLGTLSTSITKLSRNMSDIARGGGKDAQAAFDQLGISVNDAEGNFRSADQIIYDVADRFQAMPNGVEKTALAVRLFGRAGAEMIPLLNGGSEGLRAMADEADRLGFTLDQQTGTAAEAFNDRITKLQSILGGLGNKLMVAVLPALTALQTRLLSAAEEGANFDGIIAGIGGAMNILTRAIVLVFDHLEDLYDLFKLWAAARIIVFIGSVAGAMIQLAKTARTAGIAMMIVTNITKAKITAIVLLAAAIAKLTGTYETLEGWVKSLGEEIMAALPESLRQGIEDLGGSLASLAGDIDSVDHSAAQALGGYLDRNEEVIDSFGQVGESAGRAGQDAAAALDEAGESADNLAETLTDRVADAFKGLGSDIKGVIDGTSSWNDVLMNVLNSLARVGMQQWLASTATAGGGGLGGNLLTSFIGGLFGFANGGSFKVGGSGGIDSQPVAFMASPDEVVSVMTPRQQKDAEEYGGGRSISIKNEINISTPDARSFKASEQQIAGRIAMMTQRGARSL